MHTRATAEPIGITIRGIAVPCPTPTEGSRTGLMPDRVACARPKCPRTLETSNHRVRGLAKARSKGISAPIGLGEESAPVNRRGTSVPPIDRADEGPLANYRRT